MRDERGGLTYGGLGVIILAVIAVIVSNSVVGTLLTVVGVLVIGLLLKAVRSIASADPKPRREPKPAVAGQLQRTYDKKEKFVGGFFALMLVGLLFGIAKHITAATAGPQTPTTYAQQQAAAAAPTPAGTAAKFELIVSQSSCQETPSQASLNCSVGVKNIGGTAGKPVVYAMYQYTDGGQSYEQSDTSSCAITATIPPIEPGQLGYIYFCHTYNALQHDVLRAAVSLDSNAQSYPYVRVASPTDQNWPD